MLFRFMKNGLAKSENKLIPLKIRCDAVITATSAGKAVKIASTDDAPILIEIGAPDNNKIGKTTNKISPVCNARSILRPLPISS